MPLPFPKLKKDNKDKEKDEKRNVPNTKSISSTTTPKKRKSQENVIASMSTKKQKVQNQVQTVMATFELNGKILKNSFFLLLLMLILFCRNEVEFIMEDLDSQAKEAEQKIQTELKRQLSQLSEADRKMKLKDFLQKYQNDGIHINRDKISSNTNTYSTMNAPDTPYVPPSQISSNKTNLAVAAPNNNKFNTTLTTKSDTSASDALLEDLIKKIAAEGTSLKKIRQLIDEVEKTVSK